MVVTAGLGTAGWVLAAMWMTGELDRNFMIIHTSSWTVENIIGVCNAIPSWQWSCFITIKFSVQIKKMLRLLIDKFNHVHAWTVSMIWISVVLLQVMFFFSGIFAYQCFYVKKTPVMWHVKASFLSITCIYSSYSANKTSAIWMTFIHLNIHPYM